MSDSPIVLKTLMFWALTSSSASTTTRCSFLMSIRSGVKMMQANIVQHRRWHDLRQPRVACGRGRGGKQRAHLGRRNVVRLHFHFDDTTRGLVADHVDPAP